MKNINHDKNLPDQMADIASGKIFSVPEDYFENLSGKLFDDEGNLKSNDRQKSTVRTLRPWLIAASIALLALAGYWLLSVNNAQVENIASEKELNEYILQEIMEYDLTTLSQHLTESEMYSITQSKEAETYESYIQVHIDDFEGIIY